VAEISDGEIRLGLTKDEFQRLGEYEEPPPTERIQG
jgi:hypothetical protein